MGNLFQQWKFYAIGILLCDLATIYVWFDMSWMLEVNMGKIQTVDKSGSVPLVAVVTVFLPNAHHQKDTVSSFVIQNREQYCKRHGYDCFLLSKKLCLTRSPPWQKIPMAMKLLFSSKRRNYEWVWLLDFDAIIMNLDLSLDRHVIQPGTGLKTVTNERDIHIIATKDCNGLNTGSILLHRTEITRDLLLNAWATSPVFHRHVRYYAEQGGITTAMKRNEAAAAAVTYVPQSTFNAYFESGCGYMWRKQDFVLHFPGGKRAKLAFQQYVAKLLEVQATHTRPVQSNQGASLLLPSDFPSNSRKPHRSK